MADDYSFGILQSGVHWAWFTERCSTLKSDPRYTSNTVFDSFPWPQSPTSAQVRRVADAGIKLRKMRNELKTKYNLDLRDLYRKLEEPGDHPMKDAQAELDAAVFAAYGWSKTAEPLKSLLALNAELAEREAAGEKIQGPGLPPAVKKPAEYVTADCITP